MQAELVGGADGDREARVQVLLHVDVLAMCILVARRKDVHDAAPAAPLEDTTLQNPYDIPVQVRVLACKPEVRPRGALAVRMIVDFVLAVGRDDIDARARRRRPAGPGALRIAARAVARGHKGAPLQLALAEIAPPGASEGSARVEPPRVG